MRHCLLLLLCLPVVTGCGGDPIEDYCKAVEDHQAELSEVLADGGPVALLAALPMFQDLEEQAPQDIRDEWRQVTGALEALEEALDAAGVDPATYDSHNPPEDVTQAEQDRIEAAASDLAGPQTVAALAGVEQQARDVCKTPLFV